MTSSFSQQHPNLGLGATLAAICLLAGNGYFAKGLSLDVFHITLLRSLIAALAIFLGVSLLKGSLALASRRDYGLCIVVGLLLGAHWLSFFYAMNISTVTLGMTALYTYPLMTLLLERLLFGKAIPLIDWLLAPCVIVGVWMMGAADADRGFHNMIGAVLGVFSALCFAARNLMQQRFLSAYPAHHTIFYQTLTIGLVLLPLAVLYDPQLLAISVNIDELWKWLLLGICFTALPHSLMALGIQTIGAKPVAFIGCLQPAIGTLFAYWLLAEVASLQVFIGAGIVLLCAAIEIGRNRSTASKAYKPDSAPP